MRLTPVLAFLALLPGCAWVTEADMDRRTPELDNDGDGVAAFEDCDDTDAAVSPLLDETWYNGVDNNCDGKDDYDQDEDGFVATGYDGLATNGAAGSGALPGGDCDDVAPRISPQQPDDWYDGVDQNCDGLDDYDQDGDGFVQREDVGKATTYVDGSGQLPGGDCNDEDGAFRPDAGDDWYDGIDRNCDRKDDYDQDEDGWVRDEDAGRITVGVERSGLLPSGDCDDGDATIRPGATDAWYDGVDSDCREDDDYDADLDGVRAEAHGGEDCDDANADAYPGARETIGDGVDADCALGDDGVRLAPLAGYTWGDIREVGLVASDNRVYLGVATRSLATSSLSLRNAVVFFHWSQSNVAVDTAAFVPAFPGSSASGYELDAAAFNARTGTSDWFYVSYAAHDASRRQYFTGEYDAVATSGVRTRSVSGTDSSTSVPIRAVSNAFDASDVIHALYCESSIGTTHWTRFASSGTSFSGLSSGDQDGYSADACLVDFMDGTPYVSFADVDEREAWDLSYATWDPADSAFELLALSDETPFVPLTLRAPRGFPPGALLTVSEAGDVWIADRASLTLEVLEGDAVDADAVLTEDGVLFVAWVDSTGSAMLSRENADGTFTTSPLYTDARATRARVWADADDVLVAVGGEDDLALIALSR